MKIWNPKRYHDRFQTWGKKTAPKRYQKLEFQTLKDTTSTPTILPYKNPPPPPPLGTGLFYVCSPHQKMLNYSCQQSKQLSQL